MSLAASDAPNCRRVHSRQQKWDGGGTSSWDVGSAIHACTSTPCQGASRWYPGFDARLDSKPTGVSSSSLRAGQVKKIKYYYTPEPGTVPVPPQQPVGRWVWMANPMDPTGYGQFVWMTSPPQPGEIDAIRVELSGSYNRGNKATQWNSNFFDAESTGWLSFKPEITIKPHYQASGGWLRAPSAARGGPGLDPSLPLGRHDRSMASSS